MNGTLLHVRSWLLGASSRPDSALVCQALATLTVLQVALLPHPCGQEPQCCDEPANDPSIPVQPDHESLQCKPPSCARFLSALTQRRHRNSELLPTGCQASIQPGEPLTLFLGEESGSTLGPLFLGFRNDPFLQRHWVLWQSMGPNREEAE